MFSTDRTLRLEWQWHEMVSGTRQMHGPHLLVLGCNGTTAGLGYLKIGWNAHAQISYEALNLWPHFRKLTFRYWAVRATVGWGIGSSPAGGKTGQFLWLLWPKLNQHTTSEQASILLQDASSPRQQAKHYKTSDHVCILYEKPKKRNQKEWHNAINSLKIN